jgi:hypothetical protein
MAGSAFNGQINTAVNAALTGIFKRYKLYKSFNNRRLPFVNYQPESPNQHAGGCHAGFTGRSATQADCQKASRQAIGDYQ